MDFAYMIAPGTILKEYLEVRNITQKNVSEMIGVSQKHLSNLVKGKVKFTEEFALKLEVIIPDVKAEFWMDLETNYRLYILRNSKRTEFDNLEEISRKFQFKYVFKGLGYDLNQQAKEMLKLLGLKNFGEVEDYYNKLSYDYMEDDGDVNAQLVWLKLCESEIEIQNDLDQVGTYSVDDLRKSLDLFKKLLYTQNFEKGIKNIRRLCNKLGISLVLLEAVPRASIRGAVRNSQNDPVIFLSTRFKQIDTIYFAFIHEIGHLLQHKFELTEYAITLDVDEEYISNRFAREFFLDKKRYNNFILKENELTKSDILEFSKQEKVIPDIVVGFLEHDKIIRSHSKFYSLRGKIKEVY